MALSTGAPVFTDLDLVRSVDVRAAVADGLRTLLETNEPPDSLLHDDVTLDVFVPNWHVVERGADRVVGSLRDEGPSRTIEQWEVHPSRDGVIVEYAYRTNRDGRPARDPLGRRARRAPASRQGRVAEGALRRQLDRRPRAGDRRIAPHGARS